MKRQLSCNLSSINLSEYVVNPFSDYTYFDFESLRKDIPIYVKAMDDVLEENLPNHPLKEHVENVKTWRNLGIGIMGLHDTFIKLGLIYGSPESIKFVRLLSNSIFKLSVWASVELAKERGSFPGYNSKVWDAAIIKNNFTESEIEELKKSNCLRNCSLLSVAPCGSIGTMISVSTGVEPWFSKSYIRNTKSLHGDKEISYEVWAPVIKKAMDLNWHPETLITANDIDWRGRIGIQATIQRSLDTGISSTLNLPKDTTPEQIRNIYIEAWKQGIKGVTVFVLDSRDPILTTSNSKPIETPSIKFNSISPVSRKDLGVTVGATHCKKCACGTLYITTNLDKEGNLVEIFTHTSKGGICSANLNSNTRLISLALRSGVKIEEIEDQLKGIHCPACQLAKAKGQQVDGLSCPDIISRTIKEFTSSGWTLCQQINENEKPMVASTSDKCPECGEPLVRQGGCIQCQNCGFSFCG